MEDGGVWCPRRGAGRPDLEAVCLDELPARAQLAGEGVPVRLAVTNVVLEEAIAALEDLFRAGDAALGQQRRRDRALAAEAGIRDGDE